MNLKNDREIRLNFKREDFEELYFNKDTTSLTFGTLTRRPFSFLIIGFIILGLSIVYSDIQESLFFIYASLFLLVILASEYYKNYRAVKNWVNKVNEYLDKESSYKNHSLIITNTEFGIVQDKEVLYQNWDSFNFANITEERIWLDSKENILIPSKSISKADYSFLISIINEKVLIKEINKPEEWL